MVNASDDRFRPPYPCFLLVHKNSIIEVVKGKGQLAVKVLFFSVGGDERSLLVFADLGAARRFVDASEGGKEVLIIAAADSGMLVGFLEMVKKETPVVRLAPTHPAEKWNRSWPIELAIQQLQNNSQSDRA